MEKKALLLILDGWGIGNGGKSDVISSTSTPYWDYLMANYPHSELQASGENVGLPDGQMGNSEVGHLNIGAGRVLYQDLVKINKAAQDGSFANNPEIVKAYAYAKENDCAVHFMGLFSDGGVHSSMDHLKALCNISKHYGVEKTYIHAFMDGRDTDPRSGLGFVEDFNNFLKTSTGELVSIIGRYYAMDRDKRWDRVKTAYDLLIKGEGLQSSNFAEAIEASYSENVTDEFIRPIVKIDRSGNPVGRIRPNDVVIFFNYRNDRAKELTSVLTQENLSEMGISTLPLYFCTMTPYDAKFKGLHILFDKNNVVNTLGEYVSSKGFTQLRIAETEKYAHVTFFFSGGRETEFPKESRILVPSPKVATYDLQPEMSVYEVADRLYNELYAKNNQFIVCNFANGDMVGHTGIYGAIQKAIKAVDGSLNKVVEAAKANGYEVVIIADHGNADYAVNKDGSPNTAHSLNPVPFVFVSEQNKDMVVHDGILADVAPTICKILGLDVPVEMTGKPLI